MLSVKSHFTTNSKCRPPESKHAWTRLVMESRTLSQGPRAFANGLICMKGVGEVSLYLHLESEHAGGFKCPHRLNCKGLRSGERGGCT